MRRFQLLALAAIATLFFLAQPHAASSVQVNGSVTVICTFNLYLRMAPSYPRLPYVTANYTVYSTGSCPVMDGLSGTFSVLNQSSNVIVYQAPVSISGNGKTRVNSSLQFSTSNMLNLTYIAVLSFTAGKYSQSTENTFALLNYANVLVTSFTATPTVNQGAPISFGVSMINVGQAATSPISVDLSVAGPAPFSSVYQFPALSPGQSSNSVLVLGNVTDVLGSYTASMTASYNSLGKLAYSTFVPVSYLVLTPQQMPRILLNTTSYNSIGTTPTIVVVPGSSAVIALSAQGPTSATLEVTNVTGTAGTVTGTTPVAILNITTVSSTNVTTQLTLMYPCSDTPSSVKLYKKLPGGDWAPIANFTTNVSACTETFVIPPDPIVGLFSTEVPITPTPGGGGGSSGGGGIPPGSGPVALIPEVSFNYIPILISGQQGQVLQSQISLQNTGDLSEQISLKVSSNYSRFVGLSAYNLELQPNQSTTVQVFFKPNLTLSTGVYTIPVLITSKYGNGLSANGTQYLTFSIYKQSGTTPTVTTQVYLTNSTRLTNGMISIIAPRNWSIANATLVQWIPLSVAANASDLNFYGLPTNITIVNGTYRVSSHIGNLPKNQTLYEYYSIKGAANPQLLLRSQYQIYTLSSTQSQSILKVADITAPTITSNAVGIITVSMLYTGTSAQQVSFTMLPPPQITLQNYTQNVTALPNELLVRQFKMLKHPDNGTYIFQLYIKTEGANLSYGIPILINPQAVQQAGKAGDLVPFYARVIIFIALAAIILLLLKGRLGGRPKYSPERAGDLIRIREQIKRG